MPLVNVKLIEGVFTPAQKQEMVRKLTDTMVSIEGGEHAIRDVGRDRRGQKWRLGNWWQFSLHERCESARGWEVQRLILHGPLPGG
jgi:hypothetical protein